jgi:hypothetical protein
MYQVQTPLYPLPPGEGKGVVGEGIEGDFYLDFALTKQVSHFPSARIIYTIPSPQRSGFTSTIHYLANIPATQQKII